MSYRKLTQCRRKRLWCICRLPLLVVCTCPVLSDDLLLKDLHENRNEQPIVISYILNILLALCTMRTIIFSDSLPKQLVRAIGRQIWNPNGLYLTSQLGWSVKLSIYQGSILTHIRLKILCRRS